MLDRIGRGRFIIPQTGFMETTICVPKDNRQARPFDLPDPDLPKNVRSENPKSNQPSKHYQANEAPNVQRMFAPDTKSCDANPL
jgi:hypothetical protein